MSEAHHSNAPRILVGLVIGAIAGIGINFLCGSEPWLEFFVKNVTDPLGQIFLRMMIMVVIPLVFTSISLGVAGLGDVGKLGRIGAKTLGYFLLVTALAVTLGLVLVNIIQPGVGLPSEVKDRLTQIYQGQTAQSLEKAKKAEFGIQTFVAIVPKNPLSAAVDGDMLAVIFFALMVGIGITRIPPARAAPLVGFLEGLADTMVAIINIVMNLAPYGVACLIFSVTARFGFDLMIKLGLFVITVVLGLTLFQFVVYSVFVKVLGKTSPLVFFSAIKDVMLTAFSTSSSNATLPTSLRVAEEELRIPKEIAGFVIPLGATMNMNGTALFEGVTILFLAQVFGIALPISTQIMVVIMAVLMAVGTAGVPGGSISLLILVLQAAGIPGEGIALILGVDRILDMCRTVVNVTGDLTAALFVMHSEGLSPTPHHVETAPLPE